VGGLAWGLAFAGWPLGMRAEDSTSSAGPGPAVVAHGGAESPLSRSGAVAAAVQAAAARLAEGASALEAAVAATVVLEDDPSFNAGTGANIRLDGQTVQMDAAVMDEQGRFGAVAVIERVKNPVLIARAVIDTPHLILAGAGATAFARALGHPDYDPRTPESLARYRRLMQRLEAGVVAEDWRDFDWRTRWNFPVPLEAVLSASDTVGVVVRDGKGGFAAALSTGGTSMTLHGRVGDVPILGAGSYAGPAGAVAATGRGEAILREQLARRVYDGMAAGSSPGEATRRGIALFPREIAVGLIALSNEGLAAESNCSMAWAALTGGRIIRGDEAAR